MPKTMPKVARDAARLKELEQQVKRRSGELRDSDLAFIFGISETTARGLARGLAEQGKLHAGKNTYGQRVWLAGRDPKARPPRQPRLPSAVYLEYRRVEIGAHFNAANRSVTYRS